MSEFAHDSHKGLNVSEIPIELDKLTLPDITAYFEDRLPGKVLTTHFLSEDGEDIVTASPIMGAYTDSDGTFFMLTLDKHEQLIPHAFDGHNTEFIWSIYEAGDVWLQDPHDERIWYGIYDEPVEAIGIVTPAEA